MDTRQLLALVCEDDQAAYLSGQGQTQPGHLAVKVRMPDGSVVDADFNGYWDWGNGRVFANVGFWNAQMQRWSHGTLPKGAQILTPVPSFEEWSATQAAQQQNMTPGGQNQPT